MQNFYIIKPIQQDNQGLTPEFGVHGRHPFNRMKLTLTEKQDFKLVKGTLQEGEDRLYELPRFIRKTFSPIAIVSENIKKILEQFETTKLQFHKANISHDRLETDTKFFILEMEYDSVYQLMDFSELSFYYKYRKMFLGPYSEPEKVKKKITKYSEIEASITIDDAKYIEVFPDMYKLSQDCDVFCIKSEIIVNEFVKQKLEELLPNQMEFRPADSYNIRTNQADYNKKKARKINVKPLKVVLSAELMFFKQKMDRLKLLDRARFPLTKKEDELAVAENKFNVQFSEAFRESYYEGKLPFGDRYEDICPEYFYIVDSYQDQYPVTYYAIIIAENGAGDALGLLLKRDSDYEYDDTLIEFSHESGEINKYEE